MSVSERLRSSCFLPTHARFTVRSSQPSHISLTHSSQIPPSLLSMLISPPLCSPLSVTCDSIESVTRMTKRLVFVDEAHASTEHAVRHMGGRCAASAETGSAHNRRGQGLGPLYLAMPVLMGTWRWLEGGGRWGDRCTGATGASEHAAWLGGSENELLCSVLRAF